MKRKKNVKIINEVDESVKKNINYEKIRGKPLSEFIMH